MHQQTDQARASCLASSDLSFFICSLCTSDNMATAADHGEGHRDCRRRSERRAKDKDSSSAEMMIESEDSSDTSSDLCVATGSHSDTSDYTDAGSLSRTLSLENLGKDKAAAKRKSRTLTFRRKKSDKVKDTSKKRGRFWTFRLKKHFPVRLKKPKEHGLPEATANVEQTSCVCTGYRRTEDHVLGPGVVFSARASISSNAGASPIQAGAIRQHRLSMGAGPGPSGLSNWNAIIPAPPPAAASTSNTLEIDLNRLDDAYPCDDIDELRIAQRARDMEQGIDLTGGNSSSSSHGTYPHLRYSHSTSSSSTSSSSGSSATSDHIWNLSSGFQNQCMVATTTTYPPADSASSTASSSFTGGERTLYSLEYGAMATPTAYVPRTVHTQIDYVHCLVPDLLSITKCGFYWGVMDRYEAEKLLENRPEGTFLLRDSAQEEFLFSVSFRRYGRSLHARLEQWNHKFSFDSHDPGVFASNTVCGLIEHYKDPSCCMFFEPMLTISLNRSFPFSLQHMCRAVIASSTTYDGISFLPLPKTLKEYLQYYHYKQKVRVRRFEVQTRT